MQLLEKEKEKKKEKKREKKRRKKRRKKERIFKKRENNSLVNVCWIKSTPHNWKVNRNARNDKRSNTI